MKKVLFFLCAFLFINTLFPQVELTNLDNKKTEKSKSQDVSKSTQSLSSKSSSNKQRKTSNSNVKSVKKKKKKNAKKPVKKKNENQKRAKYVFKKEEQGFYKFDEKGNPIDNSKIKKSTQTIQKTNLNIGIENKEIVVKEKVK
ncbi:MAG: hypothetical protein ACP5IO_07090 [Elusimicrobiales bacterium]